MPGPVSDSRDPEFGTASNRHDVADAIEQVLSFTNDLLGPDLKNIVVVAQGEPGRIHKTSLSEKSLRVIRFGLRRALEDL